MLTVDKNSWKYELYALSYRYNNPPAQTTLCAMFWRSFGMLLIVAPVALGVLLFAPFYWVPRLIGMGCEKMFGEAVMFRLYAKVTRGFEYFMMYIAPWILGALTIVTIGLFLWSDWKIALCVFGGVVLLLGVVVFLAWFCEEYLVEWRSTWSSGGRREASAPSSGSIAGRLCGRSGRRFFSNQQGTSSRSGGSRSSAPSCNSLRRESNGS